MNNKLFRILLDILTFGALEIILFWTRRVKSNLRNRLETELQQLEMEEHFLDEAIAKGNYAKQDVTNLIQDAIANVKRQQEIKDMLKDVTSRQ